LSWSKVRSRRPRSFWFGTIHHKPDLAFSQRLFRPNG